MKYLLLILLTIGCTGKKPGQKPDVLALKEMGELATVEYTVTKIIKANDNKTWYKLGDRKILMSCEAQIKAGVDLSTISAADFTINEKTIAVRLPLPKVISLSIPPEKIKLEYQQVGVFRDGFTNADRDALATQAQAQIQQSIDSLGILNQAKANTALFVGNFLRQLGYEQITINWYKGAVQNTMQ